MAFGRGQHLLGHFSGPLEAQAWPHPESSPEYNFWLGLHWHYCVSNTVCSYCSPSLIANFFTSVLLGYATEYSSSKLNYSEASALFVIILSMVTMTTECNVNTNLFLYL